MCVYFQVTLPFSELSHILLTPPPAATANQQSVTVQFTLVRVSALSRGKRNVVFRVQAAGKL